MKDVMRNKRQTNLRLNDLTPFQKVRVVGFILSVCLVLPACQSIPSSKSIAIIDNTPTYPADDLDEQSSATEDNNDDSIDIYIPPTKPYVATPKPSPQAPLFENEQRQGIDISDSDDLLASANDSEQDAYEQNTIPVDVVPLETLIFEPIPLPNREEASVPQLPSIPSHNELLERARQNSQQTNQRATTNNSNLPAFRNLMQVGIGHLKQNDLNRAESSFTRAQRLAPRSSAVYFYLSQVALKKNQPRKAEAMARRGLSVSSDASRRRSLWQLILNAGQMQNNTRVIREAQNALK